MIVSFVSFSIFPILLLDQKVKELRAGAKIEVFNIDGSKPAAAAPATPAPATPAPETAAPGKKPAPAKKP